MVQNKLIKKIVGIISIILFTFFLAFFVFAIIDGYRIRNDIEFNGNNSTGKYISNETWKKGIDCYYPSSYPATSQSILSVQNTALASRVSPL